MSQERPRRAAQEGQAAVHHDQPWDFERWGGIHPFRTLLEAAPDAIVIVDDAGHIVLVNSQAEQLFGYPRAALLGQPVEILLPERFRTRHLDHRAHYAANPHTRPMGFGLELYALRQDGSEFPVEISLSPVEIAGSLLITSIIRDRTKWREAEEALRVSQSRFASILDIADDAIISVDAEQRITLFNQGAERVFGYEASEVLGQPLDLLLPARFAAGHRAHIDAFAHSLESARRMGERREIFGLRKDGHEFPAEASISKIEFGGERIFTVILRDISERKRAEAARVELIREQAARAAAEEEVLLRDQFLSIASHELRTPLTTLQGYAELLKRRFNQGNGMDGRNLHAVETIFAQSQRLRQLVELLMDLSRIQSGRLTIEQLPVELTTLLRRVVGEMHGMVVKHVLAVELPNEVVWVAGDPVRLEQVFQNLVDNAIKYSPAGGVVTVRLACQQHQVVVSVSDQGIGIPNADLSRLFQPFFRASNVARHRIEGEGLGLAVVDEIVRLHRGTLSVTSVEGEGTTFTVTLPLEPSQADAAL
jgi:PAS domain S-box-containing protein